MTSRMYLINRHKHSFSNVWLKIFSTSLVISKLDYCFTVWGSLTNTQYARLDRIMFRLAKLVILKTNKILLYDAFEKLNWITSNERYKIYTLEYIFKHCILYTSLTNCFNFQKVVSNHATRSKFDFVLPRMRTKFAQNSFNYTGIKLWNSLPLELKKSESFSKFSSGLRQLIIKERTNDYIYY